MGVVLPRWAAPSLMYHKQLSPHLGEYFIVCDGDTI